MPANLTHQYHAAEKKFKEARTHDEKIAALQEMLAVIPKHKGTDHLQGDIKKRLSHLRKEGGKKKGGVRRALSPYAVARAGAGQVAVIGPPNSGKSSLVGAVSHAPVTIAEHPFATATPVPGMMEFESIRIQLIDTPPLHSMTVDPELVQLLGRSDLTLLVLSAADPEVLEQYEAVQAELREHHIQLVEDPETAEDVRVVGGAVKCVVIATGVDLPGAAAALELLLELIGGRLPLLGVSCATGQGLDDFRWEAWRRLRAIRVFTKEPGHKADAGDPFFLTEGQTVLDLAAKIHRELAAGLRFARLWGAGVHDGQQVPRDHVLHDGDIVEIHADPGH